MYTTDARVDSELFEKVETVSFGCKDKYGAVFCLGFNPNKNYVAFQISGNNGELVSSSKMTFADFVSMLVKAGYVINGGKAVD